MVTDSSKSSFSTKPALGPTWAHVPNTRLFIQKQLGKAESERIATIVKSSRQVESARELSRQLLNFSLPNGTGVVINFTDTVTTKDNSQFLSPFL